MEVMGIGRPVERNSAHFEQLLRQADQCLAVLSAPSYDLLIQPQLLNSTLNARPKFMHLRKKLEEYIEDLAQGKERMHRDKPRIWRQILYSSLQALLVEVTAAGQKAQIKRLERVFDWYCEKVSEEEVSLILSPVEKEERKIQTHRPAQQQKPHRPEARGRPVRPSPLRKRLETLNRAAETHQTALTDRAPTAKLAVLSYISAEEEQQVKNRLQQTLTQDHLSYRVAAEMREKVQTWTTRQARKEEETVRRAEEIQFSSKENMRKAFRSSHSKSPIRSATLVVDLSRDLTPARDSVMETEASPYFRQYEKVPRLRTLRGPLIEVQSSPTIRRKVHQSLGAYTKPLTERAERPEPQSLSAERISQLMTVTEVKQKLVKLGEVCAYEKLTTALVIPEDLPLSKLTPESLPKDGARLIKNPFLWLYGRPKRRNRRRY